MSMRRLALDGGVMWSYRVNVMISVLGSSSVVLDIVCGRGRGWQVGVGLARVTTDWDSLDAPQGKRHMSHAPPTRLRYEHHYTKLYVP